MYQTNNKMKCEHQYNQVGTLVGTNCRLFYTRTTFQSPRCGIVLAQCLQEVNCRFNMRHLFWLTEISSQNANEDRTSTVLFMCLRDGLHCCADSGRIAPTKRGSFQQMQGHLSHPHHHCSMADSASLTLCLGKDAAGLQAYEVSFSWMIKCNAVRHLFRFTANLCRHPGLLFRTERLQRNCVRIHER